MRTQRAVSEFIAQGKDLYRQLRTEGEGISDVDLVALREQLHILDEEAGHLQELKEFDSDALPFMFDGTRPQTSKPLSRRHHD
jgi:hypothetical protein